VTLNRLFSFLLMPALTCMVTAAAQRPAYAQQPSPTAQPTSNTIHLDVVVETKSGALVPNLTQQDFTVLDNKQPQPITSFKVVRAAQEPVEVIFLLDSVNAPFTTVSYARNGIEKFLRSDDGRLAHPTTIAILKDQGTEIQKGFITDGNADGDALEHYSIGLREINRTSNQGDFDRLQISLKALHQLTDYAGTLPGRKIIVWVSPGWPLISNPRVHLDEKQVNGIFSEVVSFSTQMRKQNITLYNINPAGVGESLMQADYYQEFLNGISKPGQAQFGNVSLQVLAVHSGGLALELNSDVQENIARCLADAESWYQIEFDAPPADKPNQYHQLSIKIDKPDLTARTRDNYYSNPTAEIR
jgi:VWFA-related protein